MNKYVRNVGQGGLPGLLGLHLLSGKIFDSAYFHMVLTYLDYHPPRALCNAGNVDIFLKASKTPYRRDIKAVAGNKRLVSIARCVVYFNFTFGAEVIQATGNYVSPKYVFGVVDSVLFLEVVRGWDIREIDQQSAISSGFTHARSGYTSKFLLAYAHQVSQPVSVITQNERKVPVNTSHL